MATWEFLLQKEGDREWLSLESAHGSVLEGCYRLMAKCPHPDASIDIEINHYFDQAGLTKHRQQHRTHRSSASGLLGVIPFTYLEPGLWELTCHPQQTLIDPSQAVHLKLEVLPQLVNTEWDWAPDPGLEMNDDPKPELPQPLNPSQTSSSLEPATTAQLSPGPAPLLVLDQSAHTVFADEFVTLSGQAWAAGELTIRLRDPLTQELTYEQTIPLVEPVPQRFSCPLTLPQANCVLVGEARLIPSSGEQQPHLRASQAFMITVLLPPDTELLNQLLSPASPPAQRFVSDPGDNRTGTDVHFPDLVTPGREARLAPDLFDVEAQEPLAPASPKPASPQPELPVLAPIALSTIPSPGLVMPPKLTPSVDFDLDHQAVQLPHFCQPQPSTPATPVQPRSFATLKRQHRFLKTLVNLAGDVAVLNHEPESLELMAPEVASAPQFPSPILPRPLAAPILHIAPESLQAGTLFSLNLDLPEYHPGIGVKLWVTNAETGDLIAGPRWLTSFQASAEAKIATTHLSLGIPATVKVIALMAIAVDEKSGRESQTVVMRQHLLPRQTPAS